MNYLEKDRDMTYLEKDVEREREKNLEIHIERTHLEKDKDIKKELERG